MKRPIDRDRLKNIRLLALDVDGVLTDGTIRLDGAGGESKVFSVQDGSALKRASAAGVEIVWISGRTSPAVAARAKELGVTAVYQGVEEKTGVLDKILAGKGLSWKQAAAVGDDLNDLAVMRKCGWSAAPSQAHPAVAAAADYVTGTPGGGGAVREVVDLILEARGRALS